MRESFIVPSGETMADMDDAQLEALIADLSAAVVSCTESIEYRESMGQSGDSIKGARRHYERGLRVARNIRRIRRGDPVQFEPARPVHTFVSAYQTLKAVNRLLGLCEELHKAVGVLIDCDDEVYDDAYDAMEKAWGDVGRALRDGGVQVLEEAA